MLRRAWFWWVYDWVYFVNTHSRSNLYIAQNPFKNNPASVWDLNAPHAIMDHDDRVHSSTDGVTFPARGLDSFWAAHRPLIRWYLDVNSCPQHVCQPTGRADKCPTSPFVCTRWHRPITGLIVQLPYSTSPLDNLLHLYIFIPTHSNKSKASLPTSDCRPVAD